MSAKVTLLTYTPNPEMTVAMAAKLCYSPSEISNIRDGLTEEKTADFIDMLASIGHGSPFEHASFTFGIEGISRACSHQLVRHRIASYSQQSQRYVDGTKFDFVTPPEIAKNEKAIKQYQKAESYLLEISRILPEQGYTYFLLAKLYTNPSFLHPDKFHKAAKRFLAFQPSTQNNITKEMKEEILQIIRNWNFGK